MNGSRRASTTISGTISVHGRDVNVSYRSLDNQKAGGMLLGNARLSGTVKAAQALERPLYTQQISMSRWKPTFMGIIAPDEQGATDYFREFDFPRAVKSVITKSSWLRLKQSDTVIDFDNITNPVVYTDRLFLNNLLMAPMETVRSWMAKEMPYRDRVLEAELHKRFIQAFDRPADQPQTGGSANNENITTLSGIKFFKGLLPRDKNCSIAQSGLAGGKRLAVIGNLDQAEAVSLVNELVGRYGRTLSHLGNTAILYKEDGIELVCENDRTSDTALKMLRGRVSKFVRGFNTSVVISDTHIASGGGEDMFGQTKAAHLMRILDRLIECRGSLIVNGDFFELLESKYSDIKHEYRRLFKKLNLVRRIYYLTGNHDQAVSSNFDDAEEEAVLAAARKKGARSPAIEFVPGAEKGKWSFIVPDKADQDIKALEALLVRGGKGAKNTGKLLLNIMRTPWSQTGGSEKRLRFVISSGFPDRGVIFDRADNTLFVDRSLIQMKDMIRASGLLADASVDALEELSNSVSNDFPNMLIKQNYYDPSRGIYFEHGHLADKANCGDPIFMASRVGPLIARTVGILKRIFVPLGWTRFEEHLTKVLDLPERFFPGLYWNDFKYFERAEGLRKMFEWFEKEKFGTSYPISIVFGHTHVPEFMKGNISSLAKRTGANFVNTGSWSGLMTRKISPYTWLRKHGIRRFEASGRIEADKSPSAGAGKAKENWLLISGENCEMTMMNGPKKAGSGI